MGSTASHGQRGASGDLSHHGDRRLVNCQGAEYDHTYALVFGIRYRARQQLARIEQGESSMKSYTVVIERCPETGFYVGSVPGFPGAHSQGESLDELRENMREVITMLLEDGEPAHESEFVGTESVEVN